MMGRKPSRYPKQPQFCISVPRHVLEQMRHLAGERGCSLRYLVLRALSLVGIGVAAEELLEDGRKGRPRGTRRHYAIDNRETSRIKVASANVTVLPPADDPHKVCYSAQK